MSCLVDDALFEVIHVVHSCYVMVVAFLKALVFVSPEFRGCWFLALAVCAGFSEEARQNGGIFFLDNG